MTPGPAEDPVPDPVPVPPDRPKASAGRVPASDEDPHAWVVRHWPPTGAPGESTVSRAGAGSAQVEGR